MRLALPLATLLLLAACALPPRQAVLKDAAIVADTVWSGRVIIDGTVTVHKGATLTIRPGSEILFVRRDDDQDGLGDATLVVEGALHALGRQDAPISFASAADKPKPGDWLEIRVDFSKDVRLRHCMISDSAYTLHAHFTRGFMEDCTVRGNIDGTRLGHSNFAIRNCLFEHNTGKGINFRNSSVEVRRNILRYNGSGIFLFETDRASIIEGNNLYGNRDNLRLGDFFEGEVATRGNWWGSGDLQEAAATIHDRRKDPSIGTVHPSPAPSYLPGTGPRQSLFLQPAWTFSTGGFVDAPPVVAGDSLLAASWDGSLYALDFSGLLSWQVPLGGVADSGPALDDAAVYLQTWGRKVLALSRRDGSILWQWQYPPSPADDHRQGSLVRLTDSLLVPAWNGTLYALNPTDGSETWHFDAGMPLRSSPAVDGDRLYQPSGGGLLSALDIHGALLWQRDLGAPLLSTPAVTGAGPVVLSKGGLLVALDRQGRERWRRDLDETCFYAAPLAAGDALYVATAAGSLWKLEAASGKVIWRLTGFGPIYASPARIDGRILVGDNDGIISVVGADSGDLLASYRAGGAVQSTPTVFADLVVAGSRDGRLHALQIIEASDIEKP